jgi:hypothetical protein
MRLIIMQSDKKKHEQNVSWKACNYLNRRYRVAICTAADI